MALIDFGAVVFKNGKQMNFELFDDMFGAVGWAGEPMDGNCFAFVGDEELTLAFYKCGVLVAINEEPADHVWGCGYRHWGDPPRKSYWEEYNGVPLHIKEVCRNVYHLSMVYKGDSYHVVYGSGIDPEKGIWDRVKVDYLGKSGAKAVDKLYKRLGGLIGKN